MAKKSTDKRRTSADSADEVEGNVDKIRQILFGGQMRDYEQRFDSMEKRLTQNLERMSSEFTRRLERLDAVVRRETDKLGEQLKTEKKDRISEGKKGNGELQNVVDQMEAWFAEVDEQIAKDSKELRAEISDQGEDLFAQIRQSHEQVTSALQKEAGQIADDKLSREDMAALLAEVAMRLDKKFKLPKT